MKIWFKIVAAIALSMAIPVAAAAIVTPTLAAPLALIVPFIALSHLEGAVKSGPVLA